VCPCAEGVPGGICRNCVLRQTGQGNKILVLFGASAAKTPLPFGPCFSHFPQPVHLEAPCQPNDPHGKNFCDMMVTLKERAGKGAFFFIFAKEE